LALSGQPHQAGISAERHDRRCRQPEGPAGSASSRAAAGAALRTGRQGGAV